MRCSSCVCEDVCVKPTLIYFYQPFYVPTCRCRRQHLSHNIFTCVPKRWIELTLQIQASCYERDRESCILHIELRIHL